MDAARETRPEDFFLEARGITKTLGEFVALNNVSLGVKKGEFVSILGPSGCGKTTLLRVIAGLEEPNAGSVWLNARDVSREPVAKRRFGIVFQSSALFPNIRVLNNVMYGIRRGGLTASQRRSRGMQMLSLVGLSDQAFKYPAQLSGGQKQRVALARALAPEPSLLLLDEPLSALDARVRVHLRMEIRRIQETLGITTIMVTHDQEEALTMADRVVVIKDGCLMQFASPHELYRLPSNAFVAGFIGSMNFITNCRGKDPNSIYFGNYTLAVAPGRAAQHQGRAVTLAVRPEDIRVIRNGEGHDQNVVQVKVHAISFRGSLYRLYLQVQHPAGGASEQNLKMDLQVEAVEEMALREAVELPIHLPPEKIMLFRETSA